MSTPPTLTVGITVGTTGATPTPPALINANLIAYVSATNPGYTILPGALIEDIASTDTAAIALCDSAAVDLINSLTPDSANPWLLTKLGQLNGVQQGVDTNTSVYVVFSGTVGYPISPGFTVSDGTYQYTVQEGGVIGSGGASQPLFCVATQAGSWAVPANTVSTLITYVPGTITLTCTNPNTGTPSAGAQTEEDYRAQVMQAGLSPSQGCASYCRTLLGQVPGVQSRLVRVVQINGGGWEVICGGGDPYAVAYAVFESGLDISSLVGSTIGVTAITQATLGVVTTNLNHGLITGQNNVHIAGVVGMAGANGGPYTVTVIDQTHFTFGVNTSGFGAYVSGGVITPNNRNIVTSLQQYPDTYTVPTVNPPAQTVAIQLTWNTNSLNFVSPTAVAQLGAPAIAAYVNALPVGTPINEFELDAVFQVAIASVLAPQFLTRLVWTVTINGVATSPAAGTGAVYGDPESYFQCVSTAVTITQG